MAPGDFSGSYFLGARAAPEVTNLNVKDIILKIYLIEQKIYQYH
jgi:hypothetical protein